MLTESAFVFSEKSRRRYNVLSTDAPCSREVASRLFCDHECAQGGLLPNYATQQSPYLGDSCVVSIVCARCDCVATFLFRGER